MYVQQRNKKQWTNGPIISWPWSYQTYLMEKTDGKISKHVYNCRLY